MDNRITRSFPSTEKGNRQSDLWLAERMAEGYSLHPTEGFKAVQTKPGAVLAVRYRWTLDKAPN